MATSYKTLVAYDAVEAGAVLNTWQWLITECESVNVTALNVSILLHCNLCYQTEYSLKYTEA